MEGQKTRMSKQDWQQTYNYLNEEYKKFLFAYSKEKKGKNKKIRTEAQRELTNAIETSLRIIRGNWETMELLICKGNTDAIGANSIITDFKIYYGPNIEDVLTKIEDKIESFE